MTAWINLPTSAPISHHIIPMCSEASDSTYISDFDIKTLALRPGKYKRFNFHITENTFHINCCIWIPNEFRILLRSLFKNGVRLIYHDNHYCFHLLLPMPWQTQLNYFCFILSRCINIIVGVSGLSISNATNSIIAMQHCVGCSDAMHLHAGFIYWMVSMRAEIL